MDNIDVEYARQQGLTVFNTPAASSQSVAELVMGHFFSLARFQHDSNRQMPTRGSGEFKTLKKPTARAPNCAGRPSALSDLVESDVPGFLRLGLWHEGGCTRPVCHRRKGECPSGRPNLDRRLPAT